jgi:NAD(P)-dependent dehydrogenase (short-subunit alcohol dehydrogenase family)
MRRSTMPAVSCDLRGKNALVVGGAGYLGLPVCETLAAHGARVCIADVSRERLDTAAAAVRAAGGPEPRTVACDIGNEDQVRRAIALASGNEGRLDICVNAAYRSIGKERGGTDPADLTKVDRSRPPYLVSKPPY